MKEVPTERLQVEKFARWFHQDFGTIFNDVGVGATAYLQNLSVNEKRELKQELADLLDEFPGREENGLRNAWFRLGAQWWDRRQSLREAIRDWIASL